MPRSSSAAFHRTAAEAIPTGLKEALEPLLAMLEQVTQEIRAYDRRIEKLASERYPETGALMQVAGVGTLTALAYVLTLEDPGRFATSRAVGPYLGLCPGEHQSGDQDAQCRMTKAGNEMLRRLLILQRPTLSNLNMHRPQNSATRSANGSEVQGPGSCRMRRSLARTVSIEGAGAPRAPPSPLDYLALLMEAQRTQAATFS